MTIESQTKKLVEVLHDNYALPEWSRGTVESIVYEHLWNYRAWILQQLERTLQAIEEGPADK